MHELRDDQNYENVKTSHLLTALEGAMQIQKKKVIVGPNDAVGILLFNTVSYPFVCLYFFRNEGCDFAF
jgi:ATP-dependent DNA helicase 2 subunit 1